MTNLATAPEIVVLVCVAAAYLCRKLAGTPGHFFHTPAWLWLSSVVTGAAAVTASAVQAHGLNAKAVLAALAGAAFNAMALDNPSSGGQPTPMSVKAGKLSVLIPLFLIPALAASGCGFCQQAANKDTARCKAERVVVNCGAPEVAKIVLDVAQQVAEALASDNFAPLLDGIALDLEHRGITDAWGVITCAIHQATSTAKAKASPQLAVMYAHGQAWTEKHPAKVKDAP
jgi:hypothetical protein